MPVRYFDVDPLITGLGYGLAGLTERAKQLEEIRRARTEKREAQQKKTAIMVGALAAGAVGGIALAPVIGAAGAAGTIGAGGTAIGSGIGGTAATAGALGAGGVLSTGGTLAAGLIGAQTAAQAAGQFYEGDIAGGAGTLARPVVASLERQNDRRLFEADREYGRRARVEDATALERVQTDENIRQQTEESTIPTYGMPRSQVIDAARQRYEATVGGGPQSGGRLDFASPVAGDGMAFGPLGGSGPGGGMGGQMPGVMGPFPEVSPEPNIPGPSSIPGMERTWGPVQWNQISQLEQERMKTVDNPAWVQSHSPEERQATWDALTRKRQSIQTSLVPSQPTMQQRVQQEVWTDPQTGMTYAGEGMKVIRPTKKSEEATPWFDAQTPVEREQMKQEDLDAHIGFKNGNEYIFDPKQGRWEKQKKEEGAANANIDKESAAAVKRLQARSDVDGYEPTPTEIAKEIIAEKRRLEKVKQALPQEPELQEVAESIRQILGLYETREQAPPGAQKQLDELTARYQALGGK